MKNVGSPYSSTLNDVGGMGDREGKICIHGQALISQPFTPANAVNRSADFSRSTEEEMKKKTLLSWSSGKDSAWALHLLRKNPMIDLVGLFTVMNQKYNRVSMHATRLEMLQRQAEEVGLPIKTINLPDPCTKEQSDAFMRNFVTEAAAEGVQCMAFGDLFLEDIRKYREDQMKGTGMVPLFPLWKIPPAQLAKQMLSAGLEACISSVDLKKLPSRFAGRRWSSDVVKQFPDGIDPCGENGEIHTVVVGGPMFRRPIPFRVGEIVEREGFAYADILPLN
jgi:uncharacterized protein (TIGR00290 family)